MRYTVKKKITFLLVCLLGLPSLVDADDMTVSLMLMNNYNMRQDKDIWDRMREGFRLNHNQSKQVVYYEKLYTKNPKTFARIVNNARPYIYYILTETERNGMPSEVALLPGVESTFNPNAKSSSNAYGMWQFVPSTGKRFNLAQTNQIDERQDIVKSTQSALSYLNYLHKIFGQWEPAIGAYNWGEGNMYREIVRSGQSPGSIDYPSLNLREETANYLPKLIALASIIENPSKFGVDLDEMENKPFFAIVNPLAPTSLSDFTSQSGVDAKTFAMLNPQYKDKNYMFSTTDNVLLPVQNQGTYYASIGKPINISGVQTADLADTSAVDTNSSVSDSSDSNAAIASAAAGANASSDALGNLINNLDSSSGFSDSSGSSGHLGSSADDKVALDTDYPMEDAPINYTIVAGDTLYSIAKRFNAKVEDIRQQNNIPGNDITVGQTIIIQQSSTNKNI